jgi:hypothetical protein
MRHPVGAKLGGKRAKVYIELMRALISSPVWLPLLAPAALAWTQSAAAQAFSADYGLSRAAPPAAAPASYGSTAFTLGGVHVGPALQADPGFSGAGLSLQAGRNWFAQVAVGQSLHVAPGLPGTVSADALRIGGGYRWGDGQTLSLQITSGRGPDRLGLAVGYDWPRYFVRLSYDAGLNPVPQDRLRFSAGMHF